MKEQRKEEMHNENELERRLYFQEGRLKLETFYNDQQVKKKDSSSGTNEAGHAKKFREILDNLE